ncbi:MAG: PAS domain S-box protein [Verrucomicrobia bacterium]|nr:PAS domain S-box protein [Verrucomicrobiota bacterium]
MSKPLRILLLEDSEDDAALVQRELQRSGYEPTLLRVETAPAMAAALEREAWDIIISDYSMPQFNAPAALELLHQKGIDLPFIVVSGTIGEEVAVNSLSQGATDYMLKDRLGRLGAAVERALEQRKLRDENRRAAENLRQTEELYRRAIGAVGAVPYLCDYKTDAYSFVGEGIRQLTGYSSQEIKPGLWRQLIKDSVPHGEAAGWSEAEARQRTLSGEIRQWQRDNLIVTRAGELRWISDTSVPILDEQGKLIGSIGILLDITERKRVEEELARALRDHKNIMETIPEVIYTLDLNDRLVSWNRKLEAVTGYSAEEILNKPALELFPPPGRSTVSEAFRVAYANGFNQVETCLLSKHGGQTPYHLTAAPLKDESGRVIGLTGVGRDITERRLADLKLREQAALLDLAHDAICVTNMDQEVIYWNKSAERLYGWSAAEALGRNANELLFKSDSARPGEALKSLIRNRDWQGELHQVNKSGGEVIVESRWTLVRDAEQTPKSILIINSDVTERKKLEAQFLRAQRLDSIGTLASGIAHDLNNILAPILMSVTILRESATDNDTRKLLASIESSTQRGADIVKQLLTFARGIEGERVLLQLRHLIKELVKMVRATFPKTITLKTQISSDLWTVTGDATQLHQVLLNLCVNARDAMPDGGTLRVAAENAVLDQQYADMNPNAKPGPYVGLEVSDTGVGIPPAIIDQIFDPFFTTKEVGKGTGLGLSTVLGIVKSHGGFVTVQSEVGRGTTFKALLPAKPNATARTGDTAAIALPGGRGELVLVVDDEAPIRKVTQKTLERYGYRVETAANGTEAMAIFAQRMGQIHLVLTDISMPLMGGVALTRALKQQDPKVKVIVSTGQGQDDKVAELKALGVTTFMDKPYNTERLLVTLRDALAG